METQIESLSITDCVRQYAQKGPFELIDGERNMRVPPVALHVFVLRALFLLVHRFCSEHNLGEVFTKMPFVLTYDGKWVTGSRIPDLMFITTARWQQYTTENADWREKPLVPRP